MRNKHEPMSYETLLVIAGLFFNFTIVKMRGPNKSLNIWNDSKTVFVSKNWTLLSGWDADWKILHNTPRAHFALKINSFVYI